MTLIISAKSDEALASFGGSALNPVPERQWGFNSAFFSSMNAAMGPTLARCLHSLAG